MLPAWSNAALTRKTPSDSPTCVNAPVVRSTVYRYVVGPERSVQRPYIVLVDASQRSALQPKPVPGSGLMTVTAPVVVSIDAKPPVL